VQRRLLTKGSMVALATIRRSTRRSESPRGSEKIRVDEARRPGEAKRNQNFAKKEATLRIP
ncbi:hypothetical protein Tco_0342427, partial [Tanacetum coccineum]